MSAPEQQLAPPGPDPLPAAPDHPAGAAPSGTAARTPTGRWPGSPRPARLVADGVKSALAQPVATATAALVVAIVCLVVFATTGQSAAAERAVMDRIDGVGTRLVTAFDQSGNAHMQARGVEDLARLDSVSWAFALGSVTDVRNADTAGLSPGVALRPLFGGLPPALEVTTGRSPREGEAVVGVDAARTLGLADGVGIVTDGPRSWPVVGVYEAVGPLASLSTGVLVPSPTTPHPPSGPGASLGASPPVEARYLYAMATDVSAVDSLAAALPAVVPAAEPRQITVETPDGALALREVVAGELGASSRQLMAVVLGVGLALITVTMLGAVAGRRRDFGRRRALGATRTAIIVLVLVQTTVAGLAGTALGVGGGLAAVHHLTGTLPDPSFTTGVATLAVLIALAGAVPPALAAAHQDPVRILRVP
ncbi:FtsX-like permease family protein [Oerskovia sp. KBS0722]|uniref:FtsX-like permease family protein n=1 Tax=Oerskovia sp. KBS0722 TaxID=1179673 RepID=UPI00110D4373|nr:ABC transporter permease [Oerskovia sp. KBS0722]QDW61376.1 FtsX-like permease family protein [Oerskovia sp. KBS0722]